MFKKNDNKKYLFLSIRNNNYIFSKSLTNEFNYSFQLCIQFFEIKFFNDLIFWLHFNLYGVSLHLQNLWCLTTWLLTCVRAFVLPYKWFIAYIWDKNHIMAFTNSTYWFVNFGIYTINTKFTTSYAVTQLAHEVWGGRELREFSIFVSKMTIFVSKMTIFVSKMTIFFLENDNFCPQN